MCGGLLGDAAAGILGAMGLQQGIRPAATELGLAFAGLVVGWAAGSILFTLISALLPEDTPLISVGLLFGPFVTGIAALFYQQVTTRWPPEALRQTRDDEYQPPPKQSIARTGLIRTGLIVAAGFLAALAGSIAIGLVVKLLGVEVAEQKAVVAIVDDARSGGPLLPAVVLSISAIIFAPIAEEWLFRGLLYRRIRGFSGPLLAYAVSGAAFAVIHNNLTGLAVYMWLGLVFAATLQLTGRLAAAMAVHLANNAFVLATLFLGLE
ncbi:MAG: CPBP family intramembrane metalloprotease [Nannocystaceae bacterium]|nr:CPBP family intramembrane metalloprotease [Nannocystaceae bacterium]